METIAGGKTPGLCLVEALPAEVVALGISICDTTRDGSRIVGKPEAIRFQGGISPVKRLPMRRRLGNVVPGG
jgi:hypothetical protein